MRGQRKIIESPAEYEVSIITFMQMVCRFRIRVSSMDCGAHLTADPDWPPDWPRNVRIMGFGEGARFTKAALLIHTYGAYLPVCMSLRRLEGRIDDLLPGPMYRAAVEYRSPSLDFRYAT